MLSVRVRAGVRTLTISSRSMRSTSPVACGEVVQEWSWEVLGVATLGRVIECRHPASGERTWTGALAPARAAGGSQLRAQRTM